MTIKTWSDGETLYAADLNGNFTESYGLIHKKSFTSATERTSTNTTREDTATTFSLTPSYSTANIIGLRFKANMHGSGGPVSTCELSFKIAGSNLGTVYFGLYGQVSKTNTNPGLIISSAAAAYDDIVDIYLGANLQLQDTSNTITIQIRSSNGNTVYAKDIELDIFYTLKSTTD